ncbi:MAG: hypothetical protein AB8G99_03175, partial [Planctomycetaceae bacterium]
MRIADLQSLGYHSANTATQAFRLTECGGDVGLVVFARCFAAWGVLQFGYSVVATRMWLPEMLCELGPVQSELMTAIRGFLRR